MPTYLNQAQEHFERFNYLADYHRCRSDEVAYHHNALGECYQRAKPQQQIVIRELVARANQRWAALDSCGSTGQATTQ